MSEILNTIESPADLKSLSPKDLSLLAAELREKIIATCAANGGHLAPSLGVVELTIALHRVFESPQDRIVWDVGHQAYAHKLLTGRRDSVCNTPYLRRDKRFSQAHRVPPRCIRYRAFFHFHLRGSRPGGGP